MRNTTVECAGCGRRNAVPAAAGGRPQCGDCKAPLPWIVDAGDDDFAAIADSASLLVIVDLWAEWCKPCLMVSPALEQIATELAGQTKLVKVEVDKNPRLAGRFQVRAVPTLLILDRGQEIARQIGAVPVEELRSWVTRSMADRQHAGGGRL